MIKKISCFLIALFVIIANAVIVNAANTIGQLQASTETVNKGETFTVKVHLDYNDEITGLKGLKFNYDSEVLELVSQKINDNRFADAGSDASGLYLYTTSTDSIKSTDIYLLTFKIKDGATVNSNLEISTSDFYVYNNVGDPVDVDGITTSVKVTEKEEEQGGQGEQGGQQGEQEKQEEQGGEQGQGQQEQKTDEDKKDETKTDTEKTEKETTNTKELTQSKEETTATKELPKTGIGFGIGIGIGIGIVSILAGIFLIKYNKYKKF